MPGQQLTEHQLDTILDRIQKEEAFVFLESTRITPENHLSLLFLHPVDKLICLATDDPDLFFSKIEDKLKDGLHLAGWMSFEFGYLLEPVLAKNFVNKSKSQEILAEFLVFEKPYLFNHETNSFIEKSPWLDFPSAQTPGAAPDNQDYTISELRLNQSRDEYVAAIHKIKNYIAAGDTYQVNHTLKFKFKFSGSPAGLYKTLRRNQSVSYGAFLKTSNCHVMSFTPELFFKRNDSECLVKPMKGTVRRGSTNIQDRALADFLQNDPKNRSENVMIVDLLRNDLGRLCQAGGVTVSSLFDVETYETLHQMTSTIKGKLLPDITYAKIFKALFPSGSVTGAPKIRTMQIIRELEIEPRGIYTGAIGYLFPTGEAQFNVPIRTIILKGEQCEMGVGSGIVFDSDPQNEWEECQLKGQFLANPFPEFSLIETLLWTPDQGYWLLNLHLDRLMDSAEYFEFKAKRADILCSLDKLTTDFSGFPRRIRLTLSRNGAISLSENICPTPNITGFPDGNSQEELNLPQVFISDTIIDSSVTFLYHKTTQRKLYEQERARVLASGYYEVIFINERGEITEGSVTSLFIKKGKKLFTPPVTCGLLPGVFRRYLLETYPDQLEEKTLTQYDLKMADAIYVGNSVRGLIQVRLA